MQSEQRNFILAIVISGLILFGWSALASRWFPPANPPVTKVEGGKTTPLPAPGALPAPAQRVVKQSRDQVLAETPRIAIKTPKLSGSLNLKGARIDDLILNTYRETIAKNSPNVRLMSPQGAPQSYFASFDWMGTGVAVPNADSVWRTGSTELAPGKPVLLRWDNGQGQTFVLKIAVDDEYMFTVEQRVANTGAAPVVVRPYALVNRAERPADPDNWVAHIGPIAALNGAVNYDINYHYLTATSVAFWDRIFGTKAVPGVNSASSTGGWLGFGDKYWLTALAPQGAARIDGTFRAGDGSFQADMLRNPVSVAPGRAAVTTTYFFAGAKQINALDKYESTLGIPLFGKAIDWGWFEIVEKPMFHYLHWLFGVIGNFGLAIMALTLTVRALIFPIAQKQFGSMAQMRIVQPKMKAIQERHKDDKVKQQQEIMALYKTEKINPLAGCLPMFIQIPIFFALYKVLMLTIEMRHQPFVGWIQDLSAPDPLTPVNLFGLLPFTPPHIIAIGVLPIILGVTMFIQFKLNPPPPDPVQAQMFSIMPWVLMFVMAPFAAGLQLYWATSNILTILQQKWLYSKYPEMKTAIAASTAK
ncbi:MAG: membrane protein insertase YidC [Sphingomonadales bacterium]